MRRLAAPLLVVLVAVVAGGCSSRPASARLTVVTTTTQLTDFAKVVGGRYVTVYGVLKANVDPHDYEPTPADLKAMGSAAVILENGVGLEKWFAATINSAHPKGAIVDTSTGVTIRGRGTARDPHMWHNPQNAKIMVAAVTRALVAADGAHTNEYRAAERAYGAQLDALDREIAAKIAALPNKKLVTNHDAFEYYTSHFGLDFVGAVIPSFDTQADLSSADVASLVAKIKAAGVKAVFSESSLPAKTARSIASDAHVKVVQGSDALYGDTLGPPGSAADTYLKMERHNTEVIVDNLT